MALRVKNLSVKVENKEILQGVSLEVKPGEVVALMGPNGSGKSSLAYGLVGHPDYKVISGEIKLDRKDLLIRKPEERSKEGLFLSFQYPLTIAGVSVFQMLLVALRARKDKRSALEIRKRIEKEAIDMGISKDLLKRGLNEGFSGGEKKKMEMLQMRLLSPKYVIMDETDSGLDVDALKIVAKEAKKEVRRGTGILIITHYKRIFKYLRPDRVLVMKKGKVVLEGGEELLERIEEKGYRGL
jgi:Fe-S cluster assembly ATP-binding protein